MRGDGSGTWRKSETVLTNHSVTVRDRSHGSLRTWFSRTCSTGPGGTRRWPWQGGGCSSKARDGMAGARSSGSARQPATGRARPDPNKEAGRRQGKRRRLGEGLGAGASDEAGRDSSSTRARNRGNGGGLVLALRGDGRGQRETRASGRLVLCSSGSRAAARLGAAPRQRRRRRGNRSRGAAELLVVVVDAGGRACWKEGRSGGGRGADR